MNRKITSIVVHCSATPEGRETTVEDIDSWHRKKPFFFKGIGYHYVVYLDGSVHVGRPLEMVGAHCVNHNRHSIGICYVGGCENRLNPKTGRYDIPKDTRTPKQKKALVELLTHLKKMFPNAIIVSHHDFNPKKPCPCFDAAKEYKNL